MRFITELRRLPASRWLLPMGLWLLLGFFYIEAFFTQRNPFEMLGLGLVGLAVLGGLLEASSVPPAVLVLSLEEVLQVTLGAVGVHVAMQAADITPVKAAALAGVVAWLIGLFPATRAKPAAIYCGAFTGMTSSNVLPGLGWVTLAGALAGILYSLAMHFWAGIGGKLGTIAFGGAALTVLLARFTGVPAEAVKARSMDGAMQMAVVGVAIASVSLTYWLSEHRKYGAVFASALPSAVLVFGIGLLDAAWQLKMIPLGTAWFGASFAGMTSPKRLAGRYWMLLLMGLICGLLADATGPRLNGFGGGLGTTALVSVLAAVGVAQWTPAPINRGAADKRDGPRLGWSLV